MKNDVRYLLMGGQACVLYGAAEFSRDIDLAVTTDESGLSAFENALTQLKAEVIAVPPFEREYLDLGLAVHFRSRHPSADGFRIDVMNKMRGVDNFNELWKRRTEVELGRDLLAFVMARSDLVAAKKTQRDKDWPMIRRLVDVHYHQHSEDPSETQIEFWARELRSEKLLLQLFKNFPQSEEFLKKRTLLHAVKQKNESAIREVLQKEMEDEMKRDREYWKPLKKKLEELRRVRP